MPKDFIANYLTPIVVLLASVFAIPKIYNEIKSISTSNRREEFSFWKELVESILNNKHPLIIESNYQAASGRTLKASEIKYLTGFPNSIQALRTYHLAKRFVEFDEEQKELKYKHEKYDEEKKRISIQFWAIVKYFICVSLAIIPFFGNENIQEVVTNSFASTGTPTFIAYISLFAWIAMSLFLAISYLNETTAIDSAEKLLKQEQRFKAENLRNSTKVLHSSKEADNEKRF